MKNTLKIAIASSIGLAVGFAIGYSIKQLAAQEEQEKSGIDQELKEALKVKAQKKETAKETSIKQATTKEEAIVESPIEKEEKKEIIQLPLKDDSFPLEYGSSGARVERLQVYLMRKLGWVGRPSGVFDGNTLLRVQQCFKSTSIDEATYEGLLLDKMVHDQHKAA